MGAVFGPLAMGAARSFFVDSQYWIFRLRANSPW
jgi:hypothetical protein